MRVMTLAANEAEAAAVYAQAGAALAAMGTGGRLIGLCFSPTGDRYLPAEEFGVALSRDYVDRIAAEAAALNDTLKKLFDAATPHGAHAEWRALAGDGPELIGEAGRVADLLVLSQPGQTAPAEQELLLQAALFDSGRPVLMTPRGAAAPSPMRRALIAWNGSVETSRAVALALPWLKRCDRAHVFSCAPVGKIQGPDAEAVAAHLADHGIAADWRIVTSDADSGAAALTEAAACDCDWIVKGAYTHSRLRQLIFGGPTRYILENAAVPVLFAH